MAELVSPEAVLELPLGVLLALLLGDVLLPLGEVLLVELVDPLADPAAELVSLPGAAVLSLELVADDVEDGGVALLSLDELDEATEDGGVAGVGDDLSTVVEEVEVEVRDSHPVNKAANSTGIRTPIALRDVLIVSPLTRS